MLYFERSCRLKLIETFLALLGYEEKGGYIASGTPQDRGKQSLYLGT